MILFPAVDIQTTREARARRTIFVKGNADIRDPLHGLRVDGVTTWNGVNDMLRAQGAGVTIRVRHETATCFEAILQAKGAPPEDVASRAALFGPFAPRLQFSDAIFSGEHQAIVLSLQGDVCVPMLRHRITGALLHAYNYMTWPDADKDWLRAGFEPVSLSDPMTSMAHLAELVARLRESNDAAILVANVAPLTLGETVHAYLGVGETYAQRVRRFNLALIDLAMETDISVIDVERLVLNHGAATMLTDSIHLSALGCRLVAAETCRILVDRGMLAT